MDTSSVLAVDIPKPHPTLSDESYLDAFMNVGDMGSTPDNADTSPGDKLVPKQEPNQGTKGSNPEPAINQITINARGTSLSNLPTPGGILSILIVLIIVLFALIPVHEGGYTRLQLLFLTFLGKTSIHGEETAADFYARVEQELASSVTPSNPFSVQGIENAVGGAYNTAVQDLQHYGVLISQGVQDLERLFP